MYTDPGSGLFFAQVIIAGLLSILYRFRRLVSSKLGRKRSENTDS